ncbi:hypothetical protein B0H16DRAFT_1761913 [Mycena metata]|uniref:Uncharacterized protein n=1 Tax=Mycena metata TaxID=1033252 RepID=A0AAD7IAM2_9AGAR|nr:hypothetical protein B0H16DRAFT_1761913 [Mycena metata]
MNIGQDFENADVICFTCDHPWFSHTQRPLSAQNAVFARGGTADGRCSFFFSLELIWHMHLTCVCDRPWGAHAKILPSSGSTLPTSTTAASTASSSTPVTPSVPAYQAPALPPARPITAFTGLPRPTTASVQEQRRASIQRSLHPTQPTASSSSSTSSSPSRRKAGPPRPFSNPAPNLSSLEDFGTQPASTTATLTFGILPKVLDNSDYNDMLDPSPRYSWKGGDDLEKAQLRLQRANLIFTAEVSIDGPIFEAIDAAFREHCRHYNISFVDYSGPASDSPNTKPWVLLGPKGRSSAKGRPTRRTWVEDPKCLTRFSFTLYALRNLPFSYTANNLGQDQFVFIAPRFRDLYGPIDCLFDPARRLPDHVRIHTCLGNRVLHPILAVFEDVYMLVDSDSDDDQFPATLADEMLNTETRASQTPLTVVTRAARRQQWQEASAAIIPTTVASNTVPFAPGPLLTAAMEMTPTSIKTRLFPNSVDLTLMNMPGPGVLSLVAWQRYMQTAVPVVQDPQAYLSIKARSLDDGARTLIMYCLWLFAGQPTGLKLKELLNEHFTVPRPEFKGPIRSEIALFGLQEKIGEGVGKGPHNEVIGEAIKIVYWTEREAYQTPRLHPSRDPIPVGACVLKATGLLFLVHFIFIGAPYPASPFLFSTLFDGRKIASKFDLPFLTRFLSPHLLSLMKKIHEVPLDQCLYASQAADCVEYQYMVNIPDFDPTLISVPRSQAEHDGVCASIVSAATLGTLDIESNFDYLFIHEGFNVDVPAFDDQDRSHAIFEWFAAPSRELIIGAFDRQIKTPADILSNLEFIEVNPENNPWGDNAQVVRLITEFTTHYLTQSGHPTDPDGVLSALTDGDTNIPDNLLLRSTLFLSVLTGSTLLPVRPTWMIQCRISHDWSQDYPTTDVDGRDDYGPDISASFRACFMTFTITNNARLRQLLLSETPVQGHDTAFGRFLHGALLGSRVSLIPLYITHSVPTPVMSRMRPPSSWPSALRYPNWTPDNSSNLFHNGEINIEDAAMIQGFLDASEDRLNSFDFSTSSSPGPMAAGFSAAHFSSPAAGTDFGAPIVHACSPLHSPRARYPMRPLDLSNSSFSLIPGNHSGNSSNPFLATPASQIPLSTPPNSNAPRRTPQGDQGHQTLGVIGPTLPPIGSMQGILRRVQTPSVPFSAAVYVGLPFYPDPMRRGFLVADVPIPSSTIGDIIRSLRSKQDGVGSIISDMCANLAAAEILVAWSKSMVEVHDPAFTATVHGYQEVVKVARAVANQTSITAFELRGIAAHTPLFVLYFFPPFVQRVQLGTNHTNDTPIPSPVPVFGPSRAHTPAPTISAMRTALSNMLRKDTALDEHFLQDGFRVAALLTHKFGAAYLQIRQALILENVFFLGIKTIPHLAIGDVASWGGLRPKT